MVKVSIIVPIYNASRFLERCIKSIIIQTYKNIELILVDDGSTDESKDICDKFAALDRRIRVIHQRNAGVSVARNAGLKIAQGEYIMFCDSDDWVRDDWVEILLNGIRTNPEAWIVCGIEYIDNGKHEHRMPIEGKTGSVVIDISDFFLIHKNQLDGYCFNKIYRKNILENNKIQFEENVVFGEDVQFNLKYLQNLKYIVGIMETPYLYNADNMESATRKYDVTRFEKHRFVFNIRKKFVTKEYMKMFGEEFYGICRWDIESIFDKRNTWSIRQKINYSNYILKSAEFKECLTMGAMEEANAIYLHALQSGIYIYIWILDILRKIKQIVIINN